ncbi:30S ribosomal protein S14 [Arachnia propionica]|uniref:Small ribosomal subunit protein uS14 n=1 Tax=Arachnia propionica TaxID=1750 RepID=A0A3P1WUP7_9ACTN|nr:30S ribosomal protein S14 [Arachnia propionica]RRD48083.1 30S ribosomal protein S14 [Arachnia propionica]
MAKRSKIVQNERRRRIVAQQAEKRAALKAIIADPDTDADERFAAVRKLSSLKRDGSPVRLRNRDAVDGRPRGYLRVAGVSRVRFRELAHRGELPGIVKSSW